MTSIKLNGFLVILLAGFNVLSCRQKPTSPEIVYYDGLMSKREMNPRESFAITNSQVEIQVSSQSIEFGDSGDREDQKKN